VKQYDRFEGGQGESINRENRGGVALNRGKVNLSLKIINRKIRGGGGGGREKKGKNIKTSRNGNRILVGVPCVKGLGKLKSPVGGFWGKGFNLFVIEDDLKTRW